MMMQVVAGVALCTVVYIMLIPQKPACAGSTG
jgi:hypothetical protein